MVVLSMLAVFAVSAAAATAAQAISPEGPYYAVEGARLKSGESKEIINAKTNAAGFVFTSAAGAKVTCTSISVSGSITGSSGLNNSGSVETITFGGCTVANNGAGCTVTGGTVTTEALVNNLGYESATRAANSKILVVFEPEENTLFATIRFTGAGCTVATVAVEPKFARGGVCGEAFKSGAAIKVGAEPAEGKVGEINFPATSTTAWVEAAGGLAEVKCGLASGGLADTLTGLSTFELAGKPNWGVFTKGPPGFAFAFREKPARYTKENEVGNIEIEQVAGAAESIKTLKMEGKGFFNITNLNGCEKVYGITVKCTITLKFVAKAKVPPVKHEENLLVTYGNAEKDMIPVEGED
jgi:hypothetical protein